MRNFRSIFAVAILSVALTGCLGNNGQGNKQIGGTLLGGALGGWAGSQIGGGKGKLAATAGGVFLGMLLGNNIGQSLDRADRLAINQSTQVALERAPQGQPTVWHNPNHQARSVVIPTRTYQARGRYCREYQQEITVHGKVERAYGRACRQPDGTWQIVNGDQSNVAPVYQQPQSTYVVRPRYNQRHGVIYGQRRGGFCRSHIRGYC